MNLVFSSKILLISVLAILIVMVAITVDLCSGMYKAYYRKEKWKSDFLKRTGYKFCLYEGTMLIATCIDFLLYLCNFWNIIGFHGLSDIPIVTLVLGIYWCTVEGMSVREKADEKIHSSMAKADKLVNQISSREELISVLVEAFNAVKGTTSNSSVNKDSKK